MTCIFNTEGLLLVRSCHHHSTTGRRCMENRPSTTQPCKPQQCQSSSLFPKAVQCPAKLLQALKERCWAALHHNTQGILHCGMKDAPFVCARLPKVQLIPTIRHKAESSKPAKDNEMAQRRPALWGSLKRHKSKRFTIHRKGRKKCLELPVMGQIRPVDAPTPANITAATKRTKPQTYLSKAENTFPVQQKL